MGNSTIKAILFDYGGVLAEEGFRDGLTALAEAQGLDPAEMRREGMNAVYDSGFVLGKGTAAYFWAMMRERTGLEGEDDTLTKRILAGFVLRPWMIERVRRLRAEGYVTAILSDQTHWLDELDARDHFYDAFDRVYNSYRLGKGKRDRSVFTDVAADLGLLPGEILFVDDNQGNVDRASEAGMKGIVFEDREGFITALETLL